MVARRVSGIKLSIIGHYITHAAHLPTFLSLRSPGYSAAVAAGGNTVAIAVREARALLLLVEEVRTDGGLGRVALLGKPWAFWPKLDIPVAVSRIFQCLAHVRVPRVPKNRVPRKSSDARQ